MENSNNQTVMPFIALTMVVAFWSGVIWFWWTLGSWALTSFFG